MSYRFIEGFHPRSKSTTGDVVNDEIDRIKAEHGKATSSLVFEESRPDDAPLHDEFEWDGERAVQELGLIRARQIIRAVVVVSDVRQDVTPVRVWVHVPNSVNPRREGAYERMEVVARDVDLYARAVSDLLAKFNSAATSLGELRRMAADQPERIAALDVASEKVAAAAEALAVLS